MGRWFWLSFVTHAHGEIGTNIVFYRTVYCIKVERKYPFIIEVNKVTERERRPLTNKIQTILVKSDF